MSEPAPDVRAVEDKSKELSRKALILLAERPRLALLHFKYQARGATMAHHSVSVADITARIVGVACIAGSCPPGGLEEAMGRAFILGLVHDYAKLAGGLDEEFKAFLSRFASEAGINGEFVGDVLSRPADYASVAEAGVPLRPVRFPPDIITSRALMTADLLASMTSLEELLASYTLEHAGEAGDRYQEAIDYLAARGVALAYLRVDPWVPHRVLLSQASLRIVELVRRRGGVPLALYGDGFIAAFPGAVSSITYEEVAEAVNSLLTPSTREIRERLRASGFTGQGNTSIAKALTLAGLIAASRCIKTQASSTSFEEVAEALLRGEGGAVDPCSDANGSIREVLGDTRKLATLQRAVPERPPRRELQHSINMIVEEAVAKAQEIAQIIGEEAGCSVDAGELVGAALALTAALPETLEFKEIAGRLGYKAGKHVELVNEMCAKGLPRLQDVINAVAEVLSGKDRYEAVIHVIRGLQGSMLAGSPPRPPAGFNATCTLCGLSVPEDEVIPLYFAQDAMKGGNLEFPFSAVEYWVNQFPAFSEVDRLMDKGRKAARAGRRGEAPFRVCVLCNYEHTKMLVPPMIEVSFPTGLSVGVAEALDAKALAGQDGRNMLILDYLGARLLIPPRMSKKGNILVRSSIGKDATLFGAHDGGSLEILAQHPRSLALAPLYYYRDLVDVYLGGAPAIIVDRSGGRVDYRVPELEARFNEELQRRMPSYVEVYRGASTALKAWSRAVASARRLRGGRAHPFPDGKGGSGTLLRVASRIDWGHLLPDSLAAAGAPYTRAASTGGPPPRSLLDHVFEALEASLSLNRLREVMDWMGVLDLVVEYSRGMARLARCRQNLSFHKVVAALRAARDGVEFYLKTRNREEAVKLASSKAFRRLEMSESRCRWQREECLKIAEIVGGIAGEVIEEVERGVVRESEWERRIKDVMHVAYYSYMFFALRERDYLCPKSEAEEEAQEASSQAG